MSSNYKVKIPLPRNTSQLEPRCFSHDNLLHKLYWFAVRKYDQWKEKTDLKNAIFLRPKGLMGALRNGPLRIQGSEHVTGFKLYSDLKVTYVLHAKVQRSRD